MLLFPFIKSHVFILRKNWLGYILGYIFTIASGHPAVDKRGKQKRLTSFAFRESRGGTAPSSRKGAFNEAVKINVDREIGHFMEIEKKF